MWDVFSLLRKAQWSQAPGAHKRPSWAVIAERKKGIKVESEQQGYRETQWSTEKNKHNVLLADLSLFMSDKHPVVRVSPYASTGEKHTKASKTLVPHVPYIWWSCSFMFLTAQLFERWEISTLVFSRKGNQGNLFTMSKVIHMDKNKEIWLVKWGSCDSISENLKWVTQTSLPSC